MNCKNCNTSFEGLFCPNCGQKSSVKRLSILTVFNDFVLAITDTERGFLKTVVDLSQRPGPMVKSYAQGQRARYISAGKYTFFLVVLFTINISFLEDHFGFFKGLTEKINSIEVNYNSDDSAKKGFWVKNNYGKKKENKINLDFTGIKKTITGEKALQFVKTLMPMVQSKLFDYSKLLVISWLPLFAILSFIFFFKAPYNFAEHFTFNAFVFSHMLLIFMALSPLFWLVPNLSGTTFYAISIAMTFYLGFSYMQFFKGQSYLVVKTISALSIGLVSYFTLLTVLITSLMVYLIYENKHFLD